MVASTGKVSCVSGPNLQTLTESSLAMLTLNDWVDPFDEGLGGCGLLADGSAIDCFGAGPFRIAAPAGTKIVSAYALLDNHGPVNTQFKSAAYLLSTGEVKFSAYDASPWSVPQDLVQLR